jgi:hypothetical protein
MKYLVYGSSERGFTPKDEAYVYDAGLAGMKETPSNLLYETDGPRTSWQIPPRLWRPYYRIAAIDSEKRESGTSTMIELNHPLLITDELPKARAGSFYQARIEVSASIGHLVSQTENGKAYQTRFRNGDHLSFSLTGAPQGLRIRESDGLIAGFLPARAEGKYQIRVKVADERTGSKDERVLQLEVRR